MTFEKYLQDVECLHMDELTDEQADQQTAECINTFQFFESMNNALKMHNSTKSILRVISRHRT